jgi:transposase-like protein
METKAKLNKTEPYQCTDDDGTACVCINKQCQKCKEANVVKINSINKGKQLATFFCKSCGSYNKVQVEVK